MSTSRPPSIFDTSPQSPAPETVLQLAVACHQRGEFAQAEALYRSLLQQAPLNAPAWHYLGILCHQSGRNEEALKHIERALTLRPDTAMAHNNRGVVLRALRRYEEALRAYDTALGMRADYADAYNNRGAVLKELRRPDEALIAYDRALALQADMPDAHNNRGVILQDMHCFDEALLAYARALALSPDYADAHWNEARCRLLLGDYAEGWKKYEWRWKRPAFTSLRRNFSQSQWSGAESLEGKTILLHAEQGLGDTLQFVRYLPMVAALGAKVLLEVHPPLKALLNGAVGADSVLAQGDPLPAFDFHCPLLSLPLCFGTVVDTIPTNVIISPESSRIEQWRDCLGPCKRLRIGVVWSGNPAQQDNDLRSIPLEVLLTLASDDVELVSLQKELRNDEERAVVTSGTLRHFGDELRDFADTAALLDQMDLVISVCTSVAHLAGVMNKPVWILLQQAHDWRWLLERHDSPWYPSARLYRQERQGDWRGVVTRVADDLAAFRDSWTGV